MSIFKKLYQKLNNSKKKRVHKLKKDIDDIKQLSREINEIDLLESELPKIKIQIEVWSLIKKNDKLEPKKGFQFYIIIPEEYPDQQPIFETTESSDKPFHPYFDDNGRLGEFEIWNPNESLAQYVLDLVHLLQFESRYLEFTCKKKNYDEFFQSNEFKFINIIKIIEIPNVLSDILRKKKFNIEKNKVIENSNSKKNMVANKKFKIDGIKKAYEPSKETIEDDKINIKMSSDFSTYKLMIKPSAFNSLCKHIDWNKKGKYNKVEQGGILLGYVKHDVEKKVILGIVEEVIHGKSAVGTRQSLRMSHDVWKQMIDQADNIAHQRGREDLQIIGWYHTHPNNLEVFMSEIDMATQQRFFAHDWHFAVVINPHKATWKVFHGRLARECEGIVADFPIEDNQPDDAIPNDVKESGSKKKLTPKAILFIIIPILLIITTFLVIKFFNSSYNSIGLKNDIVSNKEVEQKSLIHINKLESIHHQLENFDTTFSMLLKENLNIGLNFNDSTYYRLYSSLFPIGSLNVDISTQFNKNDSLISNFKLTLQLSSIK